MCRFLQVDRQRRMLEPLLFTVLFVSAGMLLPLLFSCQKPDCVNQQVRQLRRCLLPMPSKGALSLGALSLMRDGAAYQAGTAAHMALFDGHHAQSSSALEQQTSYSITSCSVTLKPTNHDHRASLSRFA